MKRTILIGLIASVALVVAGAAQAATISASSVATADGAQVTLTMAGGGTTSSGFAVLLNYSAGTGSVDSVTPGSAPGFDISQAGFCNNSAMQCQGSNGAQVFTPAAAIPDSTSVFTITGLTAGTQIDFTVSGLDGAVNVPGAFSVTVVPEPTTAALMGLGLMGLALGGRRR